jgi:hypothetical protein
MSPSCPWCLEPLPVFRKPTSCPHCGRQLGREAEPEALELRFARVEAAQRENYRQMLRWGAPATAVIAVFLPFLHAGALVVVPLLVGVNLVAARVLLAREARLLLGPVRRLLTRWLARFAYLWLGLPGFGSMTVPVIGILTGVATFVVLTTIVHVSTAWSLERERAGMPLAAWEKLIPAVLAVLTVGVLFFLAVLALLLGWSVMALVDSLAAE